MEKTVDWQQRQCMWVTGTSEEKIHKTANELQDKKNQ